MLIHQTDIWEVKMTEKKGHNPTPVQSFSDGLDARTKKIEETSKAFTEAVGAVSGARVDAEREKLLGKLKGIGNSLLGPIKDKISNFSDPVFKQIEEIQSYMDVQTLLLKVLPPIRVMMTNAFGDKTIGPSKILKEAQAMIKQVQLDINNLETLVDDVKALPAQMNALANTTINDIYASAGLVGGSMADFSNLANSLQNEFTLGSLNDLIKSTPGAAVGESGSGDGITNRDLFVKVVAGLKEKGITPIIDGPSIILVDDQGNKVIDFNNGIGPIGINLTAMSLSKESENSIHALVKVPISDFQFVALVSFVNHIGPVNFAGSSVLRQLNQENYHRVPEMIMKWRSGALSPNASAVVKQDYVDRRLFEAELFTTPDWVNFDYKPGEGASLTWPQLTTELKEAKKAAIEELTNKGIDPSTGEQYLEGKPVKKDDPTALYNPKG
jgi:hypothetical protein